VAGICLKLCVSPLTNDSCMFWIWFEKRTYNIVLLRSRHTHSQIREKHCYLLVHKTRSALSRPSRTHSTLYICHAYPCTHFLFIIHNNYLPNMLYQHTFFSHSHWFVSTFIQSIKKLHINPYFSRLYITPHSTFYVPHSMSSLVIPHPHSTFHIPCHHWLRGA
jgi:hypothetical protein